jgi:hypothetical protein
MYKNQTNIASWNQAAFLLSDGVGRLKFVARKVGISSESEFINIERVMLTAGEDCVVVQSGM